MVRMEANLLMRERSEMSTMRSVLISSICALAILIGYMLTPPADITDLKVDSVVTYEWSRAIPELEKSGIEIRMTDLSDLLRIEFTTQRDLVGLAKRKGFLITNQVYACDETGAVGFKLSGKSQVFTYSGAPVGSESAIIEPDQTYHFYLTTHYYKNAGDFSGRFNLEYDLYEETGDLCVIIIGTRMDGSYFRSNAARVSNKKLKLALDQNDTRH